MKRAVKGIIDVAEKAMSVLLISFLMGIMALFILGIRPYIVTSGSMEPEIMTGSLCLIDCNDKIPEKGDIIAYKAGKITVIHRVTDISHEGYITKGDSNSIEDIGKVSDKNIIGKYIYHMENIGYIIGFLGNIKVLVVLFCLAVILFSIKYIFGKK